MTNSIFLWLITELDSGFFNIAVVTGGDFSNFVSGEYRIDSKGVMGEFDDVGDKVDQVEWKRDPR